jgi:hypothetical protein
MTDQDRKEVTEYEYEPFDSIFLRQREDVLRLVGIAGYALQSMQGVTRLTKVLRKSEEEVARAQEIERLAHEQVKADLPLLHSAATVLIWGALEAAFRDFLIRWLMTHPSARVVPELNSVRVRVAEYESVSGEDRMRFLVTLLERELAAALKPGAGRFDCLLKPFGIRPAIDDTLRRDISELAAVRNLIVHRAGVVDSRFVELCPWLGLKMGESLTIGHDSFFRYVHSASSYAAAIIESARAVSETSNTKRDLSALQSETTGGTNVRK